MTRDLNTASTSRLSLRRNAIRATPRGRSVTDDLLRRAGLSTEVSRGTQQLLTVQYTRAHDLDRHDPRHFVLRPTAAWLLSPGTSLGFGRAPQDVDLAVPLVEDEDEPDPRVPRLAGQVEFRNGSWWVTNRSRSGVGLQIGAPGVTLEVTNTTPPFPVRLPRLIVTVPARADDGSAVEHRFTLLLPGMPDDVPAVALDSSSDGVTVNQLEPPRWSRAQQRLLAAWAYPELIGLPPRGNPRGLTTRQLLQQPMSGKDANEKPLATLRRHAAAATGRPMIGEAATPAFLGYVIARRGFLGEAMAELHAEYDMAHPPGPAQPA